MSQIYMCAVYSSSGIHSKMMCGVDSADTHLKPLTAEERKRYQFELDFGYELEVNI